MTLNITHQTLPEKVSAFLAKFRQAEYSKGAHGASIEAPLLAEYGVSVHLTLRYGLYQPTEDARTARAELTFKMINDFNMCDGTLAHSVGNGDFFIFQDQNPVGFVGIVVTSTGYHVKLLSSFENAEALMSVIEKHLPEKGPIEINRIYINKRDQLTHDASPVTGDKPLGNLWNGIYPYLSHGPQQLYARFRESRGSILLCVGQPGTGKTSYIRQLVNEHAKIENAKVYLCDSDSVLLRDDFIDYIRMMDEKTLLIIEDADAMITKRTDGNTRVSNLLNLTDGIIPNKVKIIITTNLPNLKTIDAALLRAGRTFEVLRFEKLKGDQINNARRAADLPELEYSKAQLENGLTLAEALHSGEGEKVTDHGIGFLN